LQVTSVSDTTAPELQSFSFSPTSIDTTNSSQTVTFTARVTDNLSGVGDVNVRIIRPSGGTIEFGIYRISGDNKDGVYSGTYTFPQYSQPGTWQVDLVRLTDQVNNAKIVTTTELASRGFPTQLQVQAPTAASATVSGRVMTLSGRGIRNVVVTMTDSSGNIRTATTTSFGYFRFDDVAAGETYIFAARGKRFSFGQNTQVHSITEDTTNINFVADNQSVFSVN
jgi:hypothetical protein